VENVSSEANSSLVQLECRARHSGRVRTCQALSGGPTLLSIINVANRGTRIAQEALQQAAQFDPPPPSACKKGCDWCCHLTVGASIPEIIRIAEYLRQNLTAQDFAALRQRVQRLDDERRALKAIGRSDVGLACALLVNHCCTVYPVRPLMCRGFNSSDASACERFVRSSGPTSVPLYAPQLRLAAFTLDGTLAGLSDCGLHGERVELTAALRIALEVPDAIERFLAGEPIFAAARLD